MIRDIGDGFEVPDDLWNDETRRPLWAELPAGKAAPAVALAPAADDTKPAAAFVVPADWENLPVGERRALASKISGQDVKRAADADKIIDAYAASLKPEVFGDAPAPQTVVEAQKAIGGVEPDWVAPSTPKPVSD
ncbi:hypothetical protein ACQR1I_35915 [Bradyrhizobium sp. HKCCYLS2038]|uniref:hypothetical protein n=1 Tax=Bradyrhizobium sp. HKCCYLS2038 TaxID=3420764 RepID=UPI003EBAE63E